MSQVLIQQYLNQLQDLRKVSGTHREMVVREAFKVDLQVKLAIPFISPLMVLIAIPLALKRRIVSGLALSFGIAMLIAFGYWVLSAFCFSLGHSGALPPTLAAWLPNSTFALLGIYLFTAEEIS